MKYDIPIESLPTVEEKLNFLSCQLHSASSFGSWDNWITTLVAWFSFIITLIITFQIRKHKITRDTQKKVILDLMRHLMVNSATLETIITNLGTSKPIEGTLSRFATLENDLELGRFMLRAKSYSHLHNVSLKIRNYNSLAEYADKHMHDPAYPQPKLKEELESLNARAEDIFDRLLELSNSIHIKPLTMIDFAEYVLNRYKTQRGRSTKPSLCFDYFDTEELGLTYDHLIDRQSRKIIVIP